MALKSPLAFQNGMNDEKTIVRQGSALADLLHSCGLGSFMRQQP